MSDPPETDPDPIEARLPRLPERDAQSHKGDFGLVLIIGGSRGMTGAVGLAGMAALRGGAGLVRLAVPDVCLETVACFEPSYMTVGLACDVSGRVSLSARTKIVELAQAASVVACGPGMGRSLGLNVLVSWLYSHLPNPMIVDADGLNALSARAEVLSRPAGPRILTPHPGEFARLLGKRRVRSGERQPAAVELARHSGAVVVLKGHRTIVTDGDSQTVNSTGNPGMATGGSGDVLTGLIAALASQGLPSLDAARLGVYLHGLAGDLAADQMGQESLIATDLIRFLPKAFGRYRSQ